jgi:hypothetical protein
MPKLSNPWGDVGETVVFDVELPDEEHAVRPAPSANTSVPEATSRMVFVAAEEILTFIRGNLSWD